MLEYYCALQLHFANLLSLHLVLLSRGKKLSSNNIQICVSKKMVSLSSMTFCLFSDHLHLLIPPAPEGLQSTAYPNQNPKSVLGIFFFFLWLPGVSQMPVSSTSCTKYLSDVSVFSTPAMLLSSCLHCPCFRLFLVHPGRLPICSYASSQLIPGESL